MIRARMTSRLIGLLALSTAALAASSAMALTTQVYVGKTGAADTVGCGATYAANPCLTLTFALTQVSPNGAVIIKETGIYDPVFVAQPVTIQKDQGVTAWIYATSTTPAVIVSNAATDDFKLLGVNVIAGPGTNSTIGVQILGARRVELQGNSIRGFLNNAISVTTTTATDMFLRDLTISGHSSHCVNIAPSGSGVVRAIIRDSRIDHCAGQGVRTDGANSTGMIQTSIIDSFVGYTTLNCVTSIAGTAQQVNSLVQNTTIEGTSGAGVAANGTNAFVHLKSATITTTATAVLAQNGGVVNSFGDSMIYFNANAGTPTTQIPLR